MQNIPLVDLKRQYQSIKPQIDAAVFSAIENSNFIMGAPVKNFEEAFARMCSVSSGVGVSSGTSALFLALKALGIGPGDEVITVPNTFIATTEAISQCGAKVVFVDVDDKTYTIDVDKIPGVLTEKTKAIIPVHLFGHSCDMARLSDVAQKHNLKIIEDAAQAHLGEFSGKRIGSFGDAACFSFYPGKNLGAYGDAGIVVTDNQVSAETIRMYANHGRQAKYEHTFEGFNYRLDALQAAILSAKLPFLPDWTQRRRDIAQSYTGGLRPEVRCPYVDERVKHVYHLYVIRPANRDALKKVLAENGVSTGVHYPLPLHLQPAYTYLGYADGDFPVCEKLCKEILSIPLFPELAPQEIEYIIKTINAHC